jgi:hypothetical protein
MSTVLLLPAGDSPVCLASEVVLSITLVLPGFDLNGFPEAARSEQIGRAIPPFTVGQRAWFSMYCLRISSVAPPTEQRKNPLDQKVRACLP